MAAVIAYFRDGGHRRPTTASGSTATCARICRAGTIPTLTLVGTPYGLACGSEDPLDLSPGGPAC